MSPRNFARLFDKTRAKHQRGTSRTFVSKLRDDSLN
jgi:hypothetical protein